MFEINSSFENYVLALSKLFDKFVTWKVNQGCANHFGKICVCQLFKACNCCRDVSFLKTMISI